MNNEIIQSDILETYNFFHIPKKHFNKKIVNIIYKDLLALLHKDASMNSIEEAYYSHFGFKSLFNYRIANSLYLVNYKMQARFLSEYSKSITGIEIHPGASIGEMAVIDHGYGTVIGQTSKIGDNVYILNGVILGSKKIVDYSKSQQRHPEIGNNVEIGANVKVFGNIKIGNNVIISPDIVITENIPDNTIVLKKTDYIFKKKNYRRYA